MKYIISIIGVIGIVVVAFLCGNIGGKNDSEYLRIHIRANSNSGIDQNVKYEVKDAIVEALIPILADIETKGEAIKVMKNEFKYIENIANAVLKARGFDYKSKARIDNEYFPTRSYEGVMLTEGYYDALILDLGSGEGNNWWCVVYPAFCFLDTKNSDNLVYISQIWEIINSVTK